MPDSNANLSDIYILADEIRKALMCDVIMCLLIIWDIIRRLLFLMAHGVKIVIDVMIMVYKC
ncbi:hypothetical protein CRG94_03845 [Escherichia sp. E3356]|nr:hypothetical protein D9734_17275 [Escherichia sp. E14S1]TGB96241.1 hypothetical protein CRG94_03845 [Escherichia sp. E3356]